MLRYVLLGCALALCASCSKEPDPMKPAAGTPPAAGSVTVAAQLAKADKADGTVDKVVHKCAGCSLGMDGKAEYELAVEGYKMHFCKQGCLDQFKGDPAKAVLAMKVPE
jgi:YHS domain-containing protein